MRSESKNLIVTVAAIVLPALTALSAFAAAVPGAYAAQFSFSPSDGHAYRPVEFGLPALLVALASVAGALLIIGERKKAKGIWFSNSEKLK